MARFGSLLAATLAMSLTLGSSIGWADTPQPPAPNQTPLPATTSAPPPQTNQDRQPLPAPVYQNTPWKSKPVSEIASGACQILLPEEGFVPDRDPWHLTRLNMTEAWKIATGRGIKVAVIDTGVAVNNSVHTPVDRFSAWDVLPLKQGAAPNDPLNCQHGTVVASLIGAERDRRGITNFSGIAPDATVIGIRALYDNSQQEIDGVVAAIKVAITLRVDIINISQAAVGNRGEYADAIAEAVNSGIVVVAAAGNGNDQNMPPGTLAYPAVYPGVIAVGMTDQSDVADPASLILPGYVSVAAPGVSILSTGPSSAEHGQVYQKVAKGTSYSAPIVSGVVALMLQHAREAGGNLTPAQVKARLEVTADPPAGPVPDKQLGYGIVNPVRALTGVEPPPTDQIQPAPSASFTPGEQAGHRDPAPLRIAMVVAGISLGLVLLGLGLHAALPAARARGGRPADRHEPHVPE